MKSWNIIFNALIISFLMLIVTAPVTAQEATDEPTPEVTETIVVPVDDAVDGSGDEVVSPEPDLETSVVFADVPSIFTLIVVGMMLFVAGSLAGVVMIFLKYIDSQPDTSEQIDPKILERFVSGSVGLIGDARTATLDYVNNTKTPLDNAAFAVADVPTQYAINMLNDLLSDLKRRIDEDDDDEAKVAISEIAKAVPKGEPVTTS
ncbi:MAG: hypothetical protein AAFR67_12855 [Chloroflexota bacterium]